MFTNLNTKNIHIYDQGLILYPAFNFYKSKSCSFILSALEENNIGVKTNKELILLNITGEFIYSTKVLEKETKSLNIDGVICNNSIRPIIKLYNTSCLDEINDRNIYSANQEQLILQVKLIETINFRDYTMSF